MKNNKKGFTIIELVIVIAVIAILAAVLIPTFSGIIKKANVSSAEQEARNAYTQYVSENGTTGVYNEQVCVLTSKGYYVYINNGSVITEKTVEKLTDTLGEDTDGAKAQYVSYTPAGSSTAVKYYSYKVENGKLTVAKFEEPAK